MQIEKVDFMETINFKEASLSKLSLIILNKQYSSNLRKNAEAELRHRMLHMGYNLDDFLQEENNVVEQRGYRFNNYLIGDRPSIQLLYEIYFNYIFDYTHEERMVLFSELHLCNKLDYKNPFFTKINREEIKNLQIAADIEENMAEKQKLIILKEALEKREKDNIMSCKENYPGIEILSFNSAANEAWPKNSGLTPIDFYNNLREDKLQKLRNTAIGKCKLFLFEEINELLDPDIFQDAYALIKVLQDVKKVRPQQKYLMAQARRGEAIDPNTPRLIKKLPSIEKSINEKV